MIEIINAEYNVASISTELLPEEKRDHSVIDYLESRDMIVIWGWEEYTEMVGEMIVDYLKLSPEGRRKVEEYLLSEGNEFVIEVNEALKEIARMRNKNRGPAETMRLEDIKILPCFSAHPPRPEKMEAKKCIYAESGMAEFDIVIDSNNYLLDGYCGCLIAKENGLTHISVRYGRRQIIEAVHKPGGKAYNWELPGILVDWIHAGDKVIVETGGGRRTVRVTKVKEWQQDFPPFRMVIRKYRRKSNGGKKAEGTV